MALEPRRQQQWSRILDISRQLHTLADAEEWQKLVDMEADRRVLLQAFFDAPVSQQEAPDIARGIQQMLSDDRALVQRGREAQQALMNAMQTVRSGRKALAAYGDCSE